MSKKFTYVFVIAIGIGSLVAGISLCVTKNKPGNELYGRDLTTIAKNEKIVDNINILLDPVMYTEENGSVRSQVYVIPEFSEGPDGEIELNHVMGLLVNPASEFSKYDQVCNKTYSWLGSNAPIANIGQSDVPFDGKVRKMTVSEKKYFKEFLESAGYTEAEIDEVLVPYTLVRMHYNEGPWVIVVGIGCIIVGGALFILKMRK